MSLFTIILISISLAMDAFAVSVSAGLSKKHIAVKESLLLAVCFGGFQSFMPFVGWIGGLTIREFIEPIDHWVAFLLLGALGGKMLHEAFSQNESRTHDYFSKKNIILMGVATSIDALAVGISLALFPINIYIVCGLIGSITAGVCFVGVYLGKRFGHMLGKKAEILGGIILIGIGLKILLSHL